MTPRELIDAFEVLAEAPDGVKRLRELVLQLAVRGKLVPQDPADEPARVMLGQRAFRPAAEGTPFDVPFTWAWTTLSRVGEIRGGGTPDKRNSAFWEGDIPWVSPKDMKRDSIDDSQDHISHAAVAGSAVKLIPPRSLLMVVRGMILAHSFPTALTTVEVTVNQDMKALLPFSANIAPYLLFATKALKPEILELVDHSTHGTCKLSTDRLFVFPIPVPPLAEQHRIVARVDELMGLLDRLEAARKDRDATRDAARDSALAALRNADTPDEVEVAWNRIAERMPALFTRPADLEPLRQAVLQLAVRGRLVRQDPNDEPASVLLRDARAARDKEVTRMVNAGRLRSPKVQPPVSFGDIPKSTPISWAWCRWGHFAEWITYGFTRPMPHVISGIPIVTGKNVVGGRIDLTTCEFTTPEAFAALSEKDLPQPNDLLITKDGSIGRVAVVGSQGPFCINQSVAVVWLRNCPFSRRFLHVVLECPETQREIAAASKGAAVAHLSVTDLAAFVIPVPPLAEQHRIVAKVDALMALIDQLEARLIAAQTLHSQFAAAAVHRLDA